MDYSYLDRNVWGVRERIAAAAALAGREAPVKMVAAVKYADAGEITYLCDKLGVTDLGENRVQQLLEHYECLRGRNVSWHFIGTLQTNKVKYIADKVCMIHSLDSLKLAAEIDRQAKKHGRIIDVLVEINSGEEESKSGIMPSEAEAFCAELGAFDGIKLRGFMTMAPRCENKADYLKFFRETYDLVLDIWEKKLHNIDSPIISMGMSESFEEAIASGADTVRIGRCLFVK